MKEEFHSWQELYQRVTPALKAKEKELKRKGKKINQKEIWQTLVETKWKDGKDLVLYDIVSDIMNFQVDDIKDFFEK